MATAGVSWACSRPARHLAGRPTLARARWRRRGPPSLLPMGLASLNPWCSGLPLMPSGSTLSGACFATMCQCGCLARLLLGNVTPGPGRGRSMKVLIAPAARASSPPRPAECSWGGRPHDRPGRACSTFGRRGRRGVEVCAGGCRRGGPPSPRRHCGGAERRRQPDRHQAGAGGPDLRARPRRRPAT